MADEKKEDAIQTTSPKFSFTELALVMGDLIANTWENETFDPIALEGPHGVGKSQFCCDFGRALGIPVVVETMSGKEPTDIIGNPYVVEKDGQKVTVLAPPSWFDRIDDSNTEKDIASKGWLKKLTKTLSHVPNDRKPARILVLDEYNRVPPDTFGPMMNIVLTNEHHGQKMKHRTLIMLCGNINKHGGSDYNVQVLDPAQKSRIREAEISPTFDEWVDVIEDEVHPGVLAYAKANKTAINAFGKKGVIDPRTLTRLGRRLRDMDPDVLTSNRGKDVIAMFVPQQVVPIVHQEILAITNDVPLEKVIRTYADNQRLQDKVQQMVTSRNVSTVNVVADKLVQALTEIATKEGTDKTLMDKVTQNVVLFLRHAPKATVFKVLRNMRESIKTSPLSLAVLQIVSKDTQFMQTVRKVSSEKLKETTTAAE